MDGTKATRETLSEFPLDEQKEYLRSLRDTECFSIINRGLLWYNKLTEDQVSELDLWYAAWLSVTNTLTIPVKPIWLI